MTEKQIQNLITKNITDTEKESRINKVSFELNLGTVNIHYELCLS